MSVRTSGQQPRDLVRSFHVMAKPVGSRCNLDCTYCYYQHKREWLLHGENARMSDELLEEFIRQCITQQDVDTVVFTWHGGEPTLAGLDFYRRAVECEQRYAGEKRIENSFQTNGLLLDNAWCEFFKEHDFLVGLSIDGPRDLHDPFRKMRGGGSSFNQVCQAARLLQQHEVTFNALTVVSSLNAGHASDVYGFLTEELGVHRLQWLPCVEPKDFCTMPPDAWDVIRMPVVGDAAARPGYPASVVTEWSVDPDEWGQFLCDTFDLWLKSGFGTVLVNWFESLVTQRMSRPPEICTLGEVCGRAMAIEMDGSVYSCDHFVYPEHRRGSLQQEGCKLASMVYSPEQRRFGCAKRDRLPDCCKACRHILLCNGECPKNRFVKTPDGQPGLNYLCPGIQRFLTYAEPALDRIVAKLRAPTETRSILVSNCFR